MRTRLQSIDPRTATVLATCIASITLSACSGLPLRSASVQTPSPRPAATTTPAPPPLAVNAASGTLQDQLESVINRVSPSVVVIETPAGLGSGVIYDSSGDIVTNAHVVGSASTFKVLLSTGKTYQGRLVGTFVRDDLAVIKISTSGLQPATFADSRQVRVGEIVLAIGNPLGLQSSVTEGIVSAVGRGVVEPGGNALPPVIQTSAAINPGNSGGALVDLTGEVIGIPTLAATDPQMGGAAPGIGFAIPSSVATDIAGQLVRSGKVANTHRAALGITAANLSGGSGVLVYAVQPGGPAERAGIRPNDIIVMVNGQPTPDPETLAEVLASLSPNQSVNVELIHPDGGRANTAVTLGELPAGG